MTAIQAIVIVRFDEHGEIEYHVAGGEAVRLFIVDERCPHDRIYEWTQRCDAAAIREIIPAGSDIGSSQDDRHAAVEHAILAYRDGRPRLSVVDATPIDPAGRDG